MCSGTSNAIHMKFRQPTHCSPPSSCENFIHNEMCFVLSKAIVTLHMQCDTNYVAERLDHAYLLVKPPLRLHRRLLHPDYQIDELLMISELNDPGDTSNLFSTPLLRGTSSALVTLNVLTTQLLYQNRLGKYYIDTLTTFKRNMYTFVVDDNYPTCSGTIVSKQLQKVEYVIICGLQDFLPRRQGFTNLCAIPTVLERTPRSSTEHAKCTVFEASAGPSSKHQDAMQRNR